MILLTEYQQRRERILKSLDGAAAVVFAGEGSGSSWKPHAHFVYLTGIRNETGASVLFDPSADDLKRQCVLFLRPVDPEAQRWDGCRDVIGAELKMRLGFRVVARTNYLPQAITGAARRTKRLACLHSFAVYPAEVSPDLAVFRKVAERVTGVAIEDRSQLLPQMRAVKSSSELATMREAVAATVAGYKAALKMIRPGVTESAIEQTLERTYQTHGGTGLPYDSIVGAGLNGTILHYNQNTAVTKAGDLIVIDSAAEVDGYAADVTRTVPVSGKFTKEQREMYELVLRAQRAAIKVVRPGVKMCEVDAAARDIVEKAGRGDAFIHGIGHQLGLEVHDATPDGRLKPGMVITIEPGVYFPDRKFGIRIEDDILITRHGNEVLTAAIPKTVQAVETALMAAC